MSNGDGTLIKGTHYGSGSELVAALQQWVDSTDEATIGDKEKFARAPWLSFDSAAGIVDLNADTTREAVVRMLQHEKARAGEPWHVVENQRGNVNKVVFNPQDTHEGWYAYLRNAVASPTTI